MRRNLIAFLLLSAVELQAAEDPSAHGLGLLVGRASDPAVVEKLRAGLSAARPETRAAAVRVINASGVGALVPAVQEALAKETDPSAGAEMVRFLAVLARPELDADVLASAKRLGPDVHLALADGLARRGARAYGHLPALQALGLNDRALDVFHRVAGADGALGPAAAPILRDRSAGAWRSLLANARVAGHVVDAGLLVAGLRSDARAMRLATYWHLVLEERATPAPAVLTEALGTAPEATGAEGGDPALEAGHEAARRALGHDPRPGRLRFAEPEPELLSAIPAGAELAMRIHELSTKEELEARRRSVTDPEEFDRRLKERRIARPRKADPLVPTWTVSDFPRGFVDDVLTATECRFEDRSVGVRGGEVTFGADGRPRSVPAFAGAKRCDEAARVLVSASLYPIGIPSRAAGPVALVVPDRLSFLQSAEAGWLGPARGGEALPAMLGLSIREPQKIVNVSPEYPRSAIEQRRTGTVVLECVIDVDGEVSHIRLLQSVHRSLDLAAFGSVSGWKYTPTLVGGKPVPVIMTVTVNFKMS